MIIENVIIYEKKLSNISKKDSLFCAHVCFLCMYVEERQSICAHVLFLLHLITAVLFLGVVFFEI